ncbi:MAG: hypothetical protein JKX83_04920 [Pseudomonadales bacterium]|nr:hypothetical protein [Pseudomonadales bacterium]
MRIGSNPLPPTNTLVSTDQRKSHARDSREDTPHPNTTNTANEKTHFRARPEPVTKAEYVSRSQAYEQNLNNLPAQSKNAIRAYQDQSITPAGQPRSVELARIDLFV